MCSEEDEVEGKCRVFTDYAARLGCLSEKCNNNGSAREFGGEGDNLFHVIFYIISYLMFKTNHFFSEST
jgi:hypothetical protein